MPSKLTRAAYFLYMGAFLFTLIYSTPHRVHHFFDSYKQSTHGPVASDHRSHDRRTPFANDSNCVFQAAANGCQLLLTALVQFLSPSVIFADLTVSADSVIANDFSFPHFRSAVLPNFDCFHNCQVL